MINGEYVPISRRKNMQKLRKMYTNHLIERLRSGGGQLNAKFRIFEIILYSCLNLIPYLGL